MLAAADAYSPNLTTSPSNASPWLVNDSGNAAEAIAAAQVYARTGDTAYKTKVENCCRYLIGTEEGPHTADNGSSGTQDYFLATVRQLAGWVLAADLVGMNPAATGTRSGWTTTEWSAWLLSLRTKVVGSSSESYKNNIVGAGLNASNWGAWNMAARAALNVYVHRHGTVAQQTSALDDLTLMVDRFKLYTGEIFTGTKWTKTGSFNTSWACLTDLPSTVDFTPINRSVCGALLDGVIVEDVSRSVSAYTGATNGSDWDNASIDYSWHALGAVCVAAQILDRHGYDAWNWGSQALKRSADRFQRLATEKGDATIASGRGRTSQSFVTWMLNKAYGTSYPTVATNADPHSVSWTDWLFG